MCTNHKEALLHVTPYARKAFHVKFKTTVEKFLIWTLNIDVSDSECSAGHYEGDTTASKMYKLLLGVEMMDV